MEKFLLSDIQEFISGLQLEIERLKNYKLQKRGDHRFLCSPLSIPAGTGEQPEWPY